MSEWSDQSTARSPLRRAKLNDKIVNKIKELIFSRKIQVGQGLPSERELAEKFKVSRAVIGEALKSLGQSGFIEIRIGSSGGAFVARNLHLPLFFSIYDLLKGGELTLDHFYEVRRTVECASVRLACTKATAKDIERLRILNRKILDDTSGRPSFSREEIMAMSPSTSSTIQEEKTHPCFRA